MPSPALTPGQAALMDAIEVGDIDRVRRLVAELPGQLDFVDPVGKLSPLQLAIDVGGDAAVQRGVRPDLSIVRLLLDHGASPSFPSARGETPLEIAAGYGWHEAADLLRARGTTSGD
jgi:ankyrin repeat protein